MKARLLWRHKIFLTFGNSGGSSGIFEIQVYNSITEVEFGQVQLQYFVTWGHVFFES